MDFDRVYRSYFHDVYLYVRSLSADEHVAEEVTQEAFVKALKAIDSFDGSKDIRAWLFTIARNTYYTFCKREKLRLPEADPDHQADPSPAVEDRLADEESALAIHQFLHQMREPYKEVFSLRVFSELPFDKIACLFGKSPAWARVTFYRAKKQIFAYMEEREHGKNEL